VKTTYYCYTPSGLCRGFCSLERWSRVKTERRSEVKKEHWFEIVGTILGWNEDQAEYECRRRTPMYEIGEWLRKF